MRLAFFATPIALLGFFGAPAAAADDWYTGSSVTIQPDRPRAALDLSLAPTTLDSLYGTAIGTIAPFAPMDESGARVRIIGVLGSYAYVSSSAGVGRVNGKQEDGSFLVGYEWVARTTSVDVYIGPEISNSDLSVVDPSNPVQGTAFGAKMAVNFYSNPTTYSMVSGNLSFSTANNDYYVRLKAGLAISDGVFVGPEVLFLGDNQYSQTRFGVHLSGLRFGALQFGLSGGYVTDRIRGSGAYGLLDTRVVF